MTEEDRAELKARKRRLGIADPDEPYPGRPDYLAGVEGIIDELRQVVEARGKADGHLLIVAADRLTDWKKACADKLRRDKDGHCAKPVDEMCLTLANAIRCVSRLMDDVEEHTAKVYERVGHEKEWLIRLMKLADDPCLGVPECGTYEERGRTGEACEQTTRRESARIAEEKAAERHMDELTEWNAKDHHLEKPSIYNHVLVVVDMQVDYAPARDKDLQARIEAAADAHLGPVVKVQYDDAGESTVELGLDIQTLWRDKNDAGDELYAWLLGAHLMTRDLKVAVCGVNLGACVRDTAVGLWHRLANEQGLTGCVSIVQGLCGDESGRVRFVQGLAEAWGTESMAGETVVSEPNCQTMTYVQWLQQRTPSQLRYIFGEEKAQRFLDGDTAVATDLAGKWAAAPWVPEEGDDGSGT